MSRASTAQVHQDHLGLKKFAIVAILGDARNTAKLETKIKDFAKIRSMHYLTEEDKNGWPQIRVAIYMVEATNPRLLKSSLKAIESHRDCEIIIR